MSSSHHHRDHHRDDTIRTKSHHRPSVDPSSSEMSSNNVSAVAGRSGRHAKKDPNEELEQQQQQSSPISSLNSSLSKKLNRLDSSPKKSRDVNHGNSSSRMYKYKYENKEYTSKSRTDGRQPSKSRSFHQDEDEYYKGAEYAVEAIPRSNRRRATVSSNSGSYPYEEEEDYLVDIDSPRQRVGNRSRSRVRGRDVDEEYDDDGARRRDEYGDGNRRLPKSRSRGTHLQEYHDEHDDARNLPRSRSRGTGRDVDEEYGVDPRSLPKSRSRGSHLQEYENERSLPKSTSEGSHLHGYDYDTRSLPKSRSGGSHIQEYDDERSLPKSRSRSNTNNSFHHQEEYLTATKEAMKRSYSHQEDLRHHHHRHSSSNSFQRSGRNNNSFHSNNNHNHQQQEDDDYLVGEEVHVKQPPQRVTRKNNHSYTTLYDDDSDSARDAWSMAKSAFSTLPRRNSFDLYDDESPSLSSSRGGGSYGSSHRKPVSRSSSIHSHLSQSSRSINSRQMKRMKNIVAQYESDSMGSLWSGEEELVFDSESGADDRRDGQEPEFEYKLFDLEGLGIEFESSDTEDHADDEASRVMELQDMPAVDAVEEERPWWIQHLEEEGLFEYDTSTVYSTKMPPKHQFGRDIHHTLAQSMGDAAFEEKGVAEQFEDDSSTVGADDDFTDWEERLWTLARKHYKEYNGISAKTADDVLSVAKSTVPTLSDEMTVQEQEQLFNEDFESEQKGVLMFRSLLMTCIKAYVEAFHRDLSKADEKVDESTADPDDGWKDLSINLNVEHHVPLVTARGLFEQVIKMVGEGAIAFDSNDANDATIESSNAEKRAEFIASVLIEDDAHIFRKYEVITLQQSSLTGAAKLPNRKLMSSAKDTNDDQTDLDAYLYGDIDSEEKKEDEVNAINAGNNPLETRECEIRIRSALVGIVEAKPSDSIHAGKVSWADVVGNVMLSSIERMADTSGTNDTNDGELQKSGGPGASFKHTEPLAELYSLRHAPTFLLRAFISRYHERSQDDVFDNDDVKGLLTNGAYIRSRLELQGPYNAIITHLSNFHDSIASQSNLGRFKHDDTHEYMELHQLLVSSLHSHLESALNHTGYKIQRLGVLGASIDAKENEGENNDSIVSMHNYSNIVATCLEIGRALHHLGLCLGRRQKNLDTESDVAGPDNEKNRDAVAYEITAYRSSLEAYKACMYVFSKAEETSGNSAEMGDRDELQRLREAKVSVELHLADVLTAVGFCHDTKLAEYESALMAYRESLSLYIRHIGRFHRLVSNTLHNMGTIHTELKQWTEAASCYRQCLSIMKRKEEQEKSAWMKSNGISIDDEGLIDNFVSSMNDDVACTLECLAASLAKLGEYDASLVCLEQAIERMADVEGGGIYANYQIKVPSLAAAGLLSQAANIFMKHASSLSISLNMDCHQNKTSTNFRILVASLIKKQQSATDSIQKAILSRRHRCYEDDKLYIEISAAGKDQLQFLADDLITAGRLDFRQRSYADALSFFYEALVVHTHSNAFLSSDKTAFLFDKESLKSGGPCLKVTDDIISMVDDAEQWDSKDAVAMQILYLIGISHERIGENEKAKRALRSALSVADILAAAGKEDSLTCQLNIAICHVRLASLANKMGDSSLVASFHEATKVLNELSNQLKSEADGILSEDQRKYIESIVRSQLATAWCLHGHHLMQDDPSRAKRCFQKSINLLSKAPVSLDSSPAHHSTLFASSLCWEEPSALTTATVLGDANQCLGDISTYESLNLNLFQRAIELRELFTSNLGAMQSLDSENVLECYDELRWDFKLMSCYSSLLDFLKGKKASLDDILDDDSVKTDASREDALVKLGILQAKLGQANDAIESFREAEQLVVQLLGTKDHEIVANILHNMGNAYRQLALSFTSSGKEESAKEKAMECYSESIRIASAIFGNRHISLAETIQNQGLLHMGEVHPWFNAAREEQEADEEDAIALDHLKKSLIIRRKNEDNSTDLASTLYLLGVLCLRSIGRNSIRLDADTSKLANDAISYFIEALKIQNLLLGETDIDVANSLQGLGQAHLYRALSGRSKPTKSDEDLVKAYETLTSALGMRSSNKYLSSTADAASSSALARAHCMFLLGHTQEVRSHHDEAKKYYTSALRLLQVVGKQVESDVTKDPAGRNVMNMDTVNLLAARVLNRIASRSKQQGLNRINVLKKCIEIRGACRITKSDGIMSAPFYFQLAENLLDNESVDESLDCFSRSLRIYLKSFGKDSLNVAASLFGMGRAFSIKSKHQKALLCFDKALRIYEFKEQLAPKEKLGDIHREIGHNLMLSGGDLYEILEQYRSAVSYLEVSNGVTEISNKLVTVYTEMLAIMRDVFDSERDEIAKSELLDELSDVLHRLGNLHASSAEHKQAMVCFSEVLDIQRRRNTDREELRIADLLFNMGNIYVELKRPEKALKCLEESFKMTKDALGESHPELHSTLYLMGVALWELDDYEGCVEWFAQALSVLNTATDEGVDDAAKGRTLYRLGRVYEELQNEPDALKCYQECTKILKSTRSNDFELSHALFALGKLLQHRSEYEEALNCYDQSLRMHIEMGNDASAVADIKECIGLTLDQINQTNRSLAYLADALRTKTKQEGIVSCNTGKALMYIGQNYLSQGQHHDLAKSYFDAALGTFEGDPNCALDTAVCLYSVGLIQDETSEDGCLENCTQAIQIFKAKSTQLSSGLQNYDRVFARSLHHVAKHYAQQKRCVEALEFMTEAYEVKTGILGAHHEETAESQHWLGIIHLALGDDELALHEFKAALKTRVSLFGTEHSAVAESLYGLAEVHFKRDELAECRECILENIRITDSLKSDVNIVSRSKLMMGSCYQELGQFDEAKENLAESLELLISAHGGDKHLDIAEAHFRLGICLCETKNYDSSMDHFKACATIRSSLLGDLDIECANTYESLGIVQQKSSLHDDAILSFEKALAIKRASLPEVDEDIAVLLSFIGTSLFAVEKFDEALHFFSSSADIKKELFGSMDQDYVMTLLDKASALTKVGDDKQAMECYSKSVESGGLPLDSWELGVAYKNMAKYFYEHDTFESSFDGYSEAVSIFEWIMENEQPVKSRYTDVIECYVRLLEMSDHPISDERGLTCYKLANCYVEASKLEDAILMYREAIMIQSQIHGVDHVSVANSLHNLGNCYRDFGDFDRSVECLTKALGILSLALGDEHEDVADTCHCLGVTLTARSEFDEAIAMFERALDIRKRQLGPQHISTASSSYNLALVFQLKGSWISAIKYCNEALRHQRATLGDTNPVTISTLVCAGRIHYGKGDLENALKCFRSSFEQGNTAILLDIGLVYKDRGESDKALLMFTEAAASMIEVLSLDENDDDLFSSLNTRKQEAQEQDLIKLADNIMHYGSVLTELGQNSEALACFRISNVIYQAKYASTGSDHLTVAHNLFRTGFLLEKLSSKAPSELNEALDVLTEALRIRKLHLERSHPDIAENLFTLAKVHHGLGNTHDATKTLAEAIESRGIKNTQLIDYESLLQIGHMQQHYGKYQEALATFEECLRLKQHLDNSHSSIAELNFSIGNLHRELGNFDMAELKFKESLAILEMTTSEQLKAADVHFSLGILFTEQEKYSLALESYMNSLQGRKMEASTTKIDMAELLNNIGICYCGMDEYVKAQVYHTEALETLIDELGYDHPDVAFCWHSLGTVHTELGDIEEALTCFNNAVKIERTENYLQSLGICLVQLHDYEDAYVCLAEAMQMKNLDHEADDDLAEIQRHIGIIWMMRGKYGEALSMFEEALKIKVSLDDSTDTFHRRLMKCFEGALESVEILYGSDHLRYAKLLHQKGNIHGTKGEHPLAIEAYIVTLRIYKQHYGDSHLSVANSLFNLGVSLNAKGSPDKGLRCFVKSLRISKSKLGEDHLDVADTFEQMAISHKLMFDYNEAIMHFEKALAIRKQLSGGDLKVAAIMHEMGVVYLKESNLGSAGKAFKESLRIRKSKLSQDDSLIAESLYQLGSLYKEQNDHPNALKYFEECLKIYKSQSDASKSIKCADIFYSLGSIHKSMGNASKSLRSYNKAMSIYSEAYGPKDERVVACLARQGRVFYDSGDHNKALSCFTDCLDRTRVFSHGPSATPLAEERAYSLAQLGELYSSKGDTTESSSHYSMALSAYKKLHGTDHPAVADILQKMAKHYVKNKEFDRGHSCAKEALALRNRLFGHDDSEIANSHYFMGSILFECGKYREATKYMERARRMHIEELGKMSAQVADENFLLGMICERKAGNSSNPQEDNQNELDDAAQYFQDALTARRELPGKHDVEISDTLTRLGHVYYKLREYDNAVDCFSESLKLRETNRDTSSSSNQLLVADSLFDLGAALTKALDTKRALHLFTDALREYQVLLDKNDLNIAKCLGSIGEVHEKENQLSEAISYLEKAVSIYEHHFGAGEPNEKAIKTSSLSDDYAHQAKTLYVLAIAYDRTGDESASLKLYRNILKIYKALFGRDSLQVAKVLTRLANMKGKTGSVEKAMVLFDESLRIRMLHLGSNHEDVAETLFGMGIVFEKRKNYPAAMKAYSDCLRIRSSRFGSDSMEVAQVVVNIGVVRGNKGDLSGALKSWSKALTIYRKHGLEDDDALVATVLSHKHLAANLMKGKGRSGKR